MKNILDKVFFRSNNLDLICQDFKNFTNKTPTHKIFKAINSYSNKSEIRYVGGCVRKMINLEKIDDIDLATNLDPTEVVKALQKNDIDFYETGLSHGTVTAKIDDYKFEITTLRKDILTDGRHAKVQYTEDWKNDASRRDFTINAIYSDHKGNLFDPFDGKSDLKNGNVKFIGDADKRIKEDYLRILRYMRFFLNYSKKSHNPDVVRKLKVNIGGISKLSKERLFDELKKLLKFEILEKLSKDKIILELILLIFPELKRASFFSKINNQQKKILQNTDFVFLLALMIIDQTDNTDYFLYKFNLSKRDQKRIKIIDNFFKEKPKTKSFSENMLNRFLYFNGRQAVIDILNFQIIIEKKFNNSLFELREQFKDKLLPEMPINANVLMEKYKIPEGKQLGNKLRMIEEEWVKNNFQISEKQVDNIINN